jgi:hypothetical protein
VRSRKQNQKPHHSIFRAFYSVELSLTQKKNKINKQQQQQQGMINNTKQET